MDKIFYHTGTVKDGIRTLTPKESATLVEQGVLYVDLRDKVLSDFKIPDVPEIFLLPDKELKEKYKKMPADRHLILADASGLKSREAAAFLQSKGFDKVAHMAGGFVEWERDGLPVREDLDQRLTGGCACQLKPRDRLK